MTADSDGQTPKRDGRFLHAVACINCYGYTYICLTYSTIIYLNSMTTVLMHNRSSQNACLQWFFCGYTHLFCREYNQCVWIIVCMHKVKEGLYNSYITEWDILCDKVDICKHSSSISMLLLVLIYAYCFPTTRTLLTLATLHNMYTPPSSFILTRMVSHSPARVWARL